MFDKSKLPVIGNKKSGALFSVVAQKEDVLIGVRFWVEQPASHKHHATVGFRFRFVQAEEAAAALNFQHYASTLFPNAAPWAGVSGSHVSLAGAIVLPVPVWKKDEILAGLTKNETAQKVLEFFLTKTGDIQAKITKEEFCEFFMQEVTEQLEVLNTPLPDAGAGAVVLDFGTHKKLFKDGFDVTPVPTEVSGASAGPLVGQSPDVGLSSKHDQDDIPSL